MIEAAGGVLWRTAGDGVEIALVHRPKYDDWSLPKGKLEAGEHPLLAALREVREETSYAARPGRPLGAIHYLKDGKRKRVRYWSLEALDGDFEPHAEVDDLRWLEPAKAARMLPANRDRGVAETFLAGPLRTCPLLVVRHASAGDRASWNGDDASRPLDDKGHRQAQVLAELLAAYAPTALHSADLARCRQTLRPLAERLGLPVADEPLLSEAGHREHPRRAARWLRDLAREGRPAVVCTQRGPLPTLVEDATAALGGKSASPGVPDKGATVVLHLLDGRVAAAEVLDAP